MGKITVTPYMAGTVNHTTNNETAKITVTPYMAGMVNHAMNNEMAKIADTIYLACDTVKEREERLRRREQYRARRNRETAEERIKAGSQRRSHKRCQNTMMLTE